MGPRCEDVRDNRQNVVALQLATSHLYCRHHRIRGYGHRDRFHQSGLTSR